MAVQESKQNPFFFFLSSREDLCAMNLMFLAFYNFRNFTSKNSIECHLRRPFDFSRVIVLLFKNTFKLCY